MKKGRESGSWAKPIKLHYMLTKVNWILKHERFDRSKG